MFVVHDTYVHIYVYTYIFIYVIHARYVCDSTRGEKSREEGSAAAPLHDYSIDS